VKFCCVAKYNIGIHHLDGDAVPDAASETDQGRQDFSTVAARLFYYRPRTDIAPVGVCDGMASAGA
jgi:hypothetical protein